MRGVRRGWVRPDISAPIRRAAPTPSSGATATKRTTMPMPPSQCVMLRQNRMEGVSASMLESNVAPVVVNPLMASKLESRRLWKVPSTRNGVPPSKAANVHASVTER